MIFTNLSLAEVPVANDHCIKKVTSIWLTIISCIFVFTQTVESSDLTDIRTGFHTTYSRVVIQFDTSVKFQVIRDLQNGTVIIDVLGVAAVRDFGTINLDEKDRFLKKVSFNKTPAFLSITAILKVSNLRVDHYYLNRPFRIVLDIYPSSATSEATQENDTPVAAEVQPEAPPPVAAAMAGDSSQTTDPDSVEIPEVDSLALLLAATDSLASVTIANYDSTKTLLNESIIPLQTSLNSVKSELQRIAGKEPSQPGKATVISVIVAAFVLIDLILVAVYLSKRGKKRKHSLQSRKKVAKKQPVPERTNREFVEILKANLESGEMEAVRKDPEVVQASEPVSASGRDRLESMLRSFSDSLNRSKAVPLTPPELRKVVRDLGAIAPSSPGSKEVTSEELIGKDGLEFLKNLQKQSLN